ncbi:SadB/YajI family lipoprotein [Tepidibacter formicigenes]|jgi:hypothetical protein|uniref:Lipoprotein n=1 Tax=Tepidibacter formicigenes DSM 15518 TaxID=1123349 RepID=A0A1M6UAW9_9FIRM|nr:hypothetical protein [Tepidibacter formicigenes]SHK66309.1 hypothetical protein SAMN02744037_02766 [Tepidibacter formicigenes DSM 15518]
MKKFVLLIVVLFSVFLAVGCMSNKEIRIPQVEKSVSTIDKDLTKEKQETDLSNDISKEVLIMARGQKRYTDEFKKTLPFMSLPTPSVKYSLYALLMYPTSYFIFNFSTYYSSKHC